MQSAVVTYWRPTVIRARTLSCGRVRMSVQIKIYYLPSQDLRIRLPGITEVDYKDVALLP